MVTKFKLIAQHTALEEAAEDAAEERETHRSIMREAKSRKLDAVQSTATPRAPQRNGEWW